jgi:hypothetical protein
MIKLLGRAALAISAATVATGAQAQDKIDLPALMERAKPGPEHAALNPLVGRWTVEKSIFVAMGTPDKPAKSSNMVTEREWVANRHFLRDTTTGMVAGNPYQRIGFLGYNPMDRRYEWNTADNVTPIMMTYHADKGSRAANPIELRGAFTDLGVTGEANVGKTVAMRTVITITDADHHRFDIYFTPPGGREVLADRMLFTRVK